MLRVNETAHSVAGDVLGIVREALEVVGRPVSTSYVAAGAISWDDCCGTLVVMPERVFRSTAFPLESNDAELCWGGFVCVDLVVLLIRCVPTVTDQGAAPPVDSMAVAYQALLEDAAAVWNRLEGPMPHGWSRAGLNQLFSGDQGGCVGVETRLTVGLDQDELDDGWP